MAVNIFHDDNSVIDQYANGKNQRKQRHPVEGKTPGPGSKQGQRQGDNNGAANYYRLSPAEGNQHQNDDQAGGEDEFMDQGLCFVISGYAVITGHGDLDIVRDKNAA